MSKRENEAVVNRYLLSTLYFVVFLFALFMLNNIMGNPKTFMYYSVINSALIIIGVLGIITFAVLAFTKVMSLYNAIYYIVIFLMITITGVFVQYYYLLPEALSVKLMSVATRYKLIAILSVLIYLYELIRYFMKVNK